MLISMLMVMLAAPGGPTGADAGWAVTLRALDHHLERRPRAAAEDVYKLLHQSVFGPGHMVSDRAAAARYLEHELAGLGSTGTDEVLCEAIGGDPALVRVHLRPLRDGRGDMAMLTDTFVSSANQVKGSPLRMADLLAAAEARLQAGGHHGIAADLDQLHRKLQASGFPAVHHSDAFRAAYRPAYRVVLRQLAVGHGWCDGGDGRQDRAVDSSVQD